MLESFSSEKNLVPIFRQEEKIQRPFHVANVLAANRDSFRCILSVAATRSIDEDSFVQGLLIALRQDPKNLPALRLLAWHQIRQGAWANAKRTVSDLIEFWPNIVDTRRELLRLDILDPDEDGEQILKNASSEFHNKLTRTSSQAQSAVSTSKSTPTMKAELVASIDQFCATVFRSGANFDPSIPEASRHVFLRAMEKILAANTIALVANGPSLKASKAGEAIDAHDLVIRCNFPVFTPFGEDVGTRADIVFFNESLVDALPNLMNKEGAYASCFGLAFHPEPGPLFSPELYEKTMTGQISRISPKLREFYRSFFYTRPTTGLMAIILISVVLGKNLTIYGFDFYKQSSAHYFPSSSPVFLGHELQYEQWFLQTFLPWLNSSAIQSGLPFRN